MAKMQNPELKVVRFSAEDVIATSGGVTLSNFGDGTGANNVWTVGGRDYNANGIGGANNSQSDLLKALGTGDDASKVKFYSGYGNAAPLNLIWQNDSNGDYHKALNGSYAWFDTGSQGAAWYKTGD